MLTVIDDDSADNDDEELCPANCFQIAQLWASINRDDDDDDDVNMMMMTKMVLTFRFCAQCLNSSK